MRLRNTLILAIVAVVLAGYFFLVEQPRHRKSQERMKSSSDLASFDPRNAAFLSIERPDVVLHFVRRDGRWYLASPLSDRADDGSVNRLIVLAADAEIAAVCRAAVDRIADAGVEVVESGPLFDAEELMELRRVAPHG